MDLNIRQQKAVDAMRRGAIAVIARGESAEIDHETYPSAMFDKLSSMGLCVRGGSGDHRFWKSK